MFEKLVQVQSTVCSPLYHTFDDFDPPSCPFLCIFLHFLVINRRHQRGLKCLKLLAIKLVSDEVVQLRGRSLEINNTEILLLRCIICKVTLKDREVLGQ